MDEPIIQGQLFKRFVPLPKGFYYLVLDHSAPVGRTVPPAQVGDDRAAKLDYVVQLGDELTLKVIRVDPNERRIGLSLKDLAADLVVTEEQEHHGRRGGGRRRERDRYADDDDD